MAPHTARPTAAPGRWSKYRARAAGAHTRPLPTTGRIANTIVTTPQKRAFGRPASAKPRPTSVPWIAAVRPGPMRGEALTAPNRTRSVSAFLAGKGEEGPVRG